MNHRLGLCAAFVSLWPALAAADPARCDAVFIGPAQGCSLSGEWSVAATGRSESQARRMVMERLGATIQAGADLQAQKVAGTMAMMTAGPDQETCAAAAIERAHVSCVEEDTLADDQICFADLPDDDCYDGLALDYVGTGWKIAEKGRADLCLAVEQRLSDRGASQAEIKSCQVSCARNATVRCVPR